MKLIIARGTRFLLLFVFTSLISQAVLSQHGWKFIEYPDGNHRLQDPLGRTVTLFGARGGAMYVAPNGLAVATFAHFRRYVDVSIYTSTLKGGLRELAVPRVPADELLKRIIASNKSSGLKLRAHFHTTSDQRWLTANVFSYRYFLHIVDERDDPGAAPWDCLATVTLEFAGPDASRATLQLSDITFSKQVE